MSKHIAQNLKDTRKIAGNLLAAISSLKSAKSATVVGLSGELGAGKTAFVKAAAKILGVRSTVNSPTFVILKKHPVPEQVRHGAGRPKDTQHKYLIHIDAYRLKNEKELKALDWSKIVQDPRNLIFIEWPENVKKIMPRRAHKITITHRPDGSREFKL